MRRLEGMFVMGVQCIAFRCATYLEQAKFIWVADWFEVCYLSAPHAVHPLCSQTPLVQLGDSESLA